MNTSGEWVSGDLWVPEGLNLSPSRETPGLNRALLFSAGEKGTSGPAEFRPSMPDTESAGSSLPDLGDSDVLKLLAVAAVALAVGVVATIVVVRHGSRIKAWWNDVARPALLSRLSKFAGIDPSQVVDPDTNMASIGHVTATAFSKEVEVVVDDVCEDMSSVEAQQRLLTVLMAAALIAEQMRKLGGARIVEDDLQALNKTMEILSTSEVAEAVNAAMEEGASFLDDETRVDFYALFRSRRMVDGKWETLNSRKIEDALRLDPNRMSALEASDDDLDDIPERSGLPDRTGL